MSQSQNKEEHAKIQGIFSSQEIRKVGTGTTTRKTIQKTYWQSVEMEDGTVEVQPLNTNYVPTGPKRIVSREEFLTKFAPEPEFYVTTVFPKMKELNKTIARGDRHRANGEGFSAEMEYNSALKVDEDNIRANFGLGLTYLERGDTSKADNIFERLVKLDASFDGEHKHLFNEFGISLRKNNMIEQAVDYYSRAIELSPHDENLVYNIGRAYLEKKDYKKAADSFLKALEVDPVHEASMKALIWMHGKNLIAEEGKSSVGAALIKAKKMMAAKGSTD